MILENVNAPWRQAMTETTAATATGTTRQANEWRPCDWKSVEQLQQQQQTASTR